MAALAMISSKWKTITPFKQNEVERLGLSRNFSKVLIVRTSSDFEVSGTLIDRKSLPKVKGNRFLPRWSQLEGGPQAPEQTDKRKSASERPA